MTKTKATSLLLHSFISFVITAGTGLLGLIADGSTMSTPALVAIGVGALVSVAKDVQSRLSPPPK